MCHTYFSCLQGEHCEIDTNECRSNPCLNGATCTNLLDDFSCTCAAGFTDYNCNLDVDECANSICGPNGHCLVCYVLANESIIYSYSPSLPFSSISLLPFSPISHLPISPPSLSPPSPLSPISLSPPSSPLPPSLPSPPSPLLIHRTQTVATFVPVTLATLGPTVKWTLTNVSPNPARMEEPAL